MAADHEGLKAEIARIYGTPAVVIDLDKVEANIARLQAVCDAKGVANRPHIKTHKSPELARLQIEAGARGITCQKLGEAEVMADGGIDDILISYNILGEQKLGRLGHLQRRVPVTIAGLPQAAEIAGRDLEVVVECDTGRQRAGVETPGEAVELAKLIAGSKGLRFAGFLMYPPEDGWARTQVFLDTANAGLREAGLEASIVSTGGSPNIPHIGELKGATEHRARSHAGRGRGGNAGGLRVDRLRDGGQPGRAGARHPRLRLQDADERFRRARRPRPYPRIPRGAHREICRGARLPRSLGEQ